jgi:hypothetical protein
VREHTEKIKPPRALFVPFPFGHAFGRPNDTVVQHRVLRAALDLLAEPSGPVLRDFPDDTESGDQPPAPTQASAVKVATAVPQDAVAEIRGVQSRHAQWIAKHGGRTAFGLSGVTTDRFDEVARFLKNFADGADADFRGRRPEVPLPAFIRWSADDAKALYYESYLAGKPDAGGDEIARWFWGETAMGQILRGVKERLDASDDPKWKAAAFGVAR